MATGIRKYEKKIKHDEYRDFYVKNYRECGVDLTGLHIDEKKFLFYFHWVKKNIDYSNESGSYIQYPKETIRKGQGDCQDQTVLVASLYLNDCFSVKIVRVSKRDGSGGHVLPMISPPKSAGPRDCYKSTDIRVRETYYYQKIDGDKFFFADPTHCRRVGALDSLEGKYASENPSGFEFINQRSSAVIESERLIFN